MAAIDNKKQDFVLVDLSKLNKVKVDPKRRTATAEPGVTGLELYTETIKYGLHFAGPHTSRVTLGGFLLQGGMGIGSRLHGAGVDNILGFDIVTQDGRTVYADAKTNKDLFYAVRGGGQFFGVVTKFYLRLVPIVKNPSLTPKYDAKSVKIDQVFAIFDRPQASDLLSFYGKYDPRPPRPGEQGHLCGRRRHQQQAVPLCLGLGRPLQLLDSCPKVAGPDHQMVQDLPTNFATSDPSDYQGVISGSDAGWADSDLSYYAEDVWFKVPLDPKLQQILVKQWDKVPSALSSMALNTGTWDAPTKNALGFDRSYSLCIYSVWKRNGTEAWDHKNKAWADETLKAIKPYTLGYYANELRPKKLQDRNYWEKCYEKKTYKTLKVTKNKWDPNNVFKSL
ncbi:MAG: hypothetical protein BYD32DRAFT_410445 [Podila humilis]|nr:MAG: hypothetical protein BYD32DRAFT_410445 [Podila humilis]